MRLTIVGLVFALVVSVSPAQDGGPEGDIARGQEVFEAQCFDCHNADSDVFKTGPGFKGVKNGKLPSGKDATRETILQIVNLGVEDQMPSYAEVLSGQEKEDVVAYVLSR
jgi:mono/diheme cytochrome c family protein